jgi:hypothetical protein
MKPEFLADLIDRFFDAAIAPFADRLAVIEARPAPQDGKSVALEDVRPLVAELVEDRMRTLPPTKDGEPGKSVTVGEVVDALEPRIDAAIARAVLDVERRAQGVLERAVERMPKPANGKDGADGFSLDDLQIEDDGEGALTLRFVRGELVRERTIRLPSVSDRGVFREGDDYRKGAGVSFGGSWWIAQKDAPQGKPGSSEDWRLAVKRGRDGRDSEK